MIVFLVLLYLAFLVAVMWGYVRIIQKAGYSGWYVLLGLVPIVNVIMFFVFAFSTWPAQRELQEARARLAAAGRPAVGQAQPARPLEQSPPLYGT